MTRTDLRILCTALAFTALVLREGGDQGEAKRARTVAGLIERFCVTEFPECFGGGDVDAGLDGPAEIDRAIDRYKDELRTRESAEPPADRATLLQFYDRLLLRQARRQQRQFYATAPDQMIADRVVKLVDEEIDSEGDRS